jgi:thioredoxin 1
MVLIISVVSIVLLFFVVFFFSPYIASRRLEGKPAPALDQDSASTSSNALYYFFSPRCPPCRQMGPVIDRLAATHENVVKIDVSVHPETARLFGVRATPTTLVVRDGRVSKAVLGARSFENLSRLLAN